MLCSEVSTGDLSGLFTSVPRDMIKARDKDKAFSVVFNGTFYVDLCRFLYLQNLPFAA